MPAYDKYDEDKLLALLRSGDESAFNEIYQRYWKKIFLLATNALGSVEEGEECVQDIFCSIWQRRETLFLKFSLYTYLAVAVKYRVINALDKRYRKRQKIAALLPHQLPGFAEPADVGLLEKELMAQLEASVASLPEKCRIVYRMSREEGMTHRQIAQELTISEKTVNNHITKALKDISANLKGGLQFIVVTEFIRDMIEKN